MLWNASTINGYAIVASDGRLGAVSDLLFDDASWLVRWVVVDTGNWLSGRKVLLPASVLGHLDRKGEQFSVRLTKQQVKDSPDIDTERPVSRQMETNVYDYYGWRPYWGSGFYVGGYGYGGGYGYMGGPGYLSGVGAASPSPESRRLQEHIADTQRRDEDPHLRSVTAVAGYHIHATDGKVGHVEDFLVEDADWSIHYLIVDTKNWWPGKKVLISPRSVREIDWSDKLVRLDVDRQKVKDSPAYDSSTTVDRAYETQFHSYYGGAPPNDRPDRASVG
jgi:sporulation protein YlmC with PRC-barrel domain